MDDIELVGVSTIGADCYLEPSVASCKIINRFSNKSLQVARPMNVGLILFQKNGECMHSLWMRYPY